METAIYLREVGMVPVSIDTAGFAYDIEGNCYQQDQDGHWGKIRCGEKVVQLGQHGGRTDPKNSHHSVPVKAKK